MFRFATLAEDKTNRQDYRTQYRRDYGRVIHSPAFRRLQNKTQLFPGQENDFFRNRLTHSLEVAQIAKSIAFKLMEQYPELSSLIEPDVCEIAGLIHDMGHPPFGHNGENALNKCMKEHGGFEGNAQTLRIITHLEKTESPLNIFDNAGDEDCRSGLNLTARVIASALKYDNCIPQQVERVTKGYYDTERKIVDKVKECVLGFAPNKSIKFKTIECSIMDLADDIAYSTYDIEDAFKAGFLSPLEMIAADNEIFIKIADKLTKDKIYCTESTCRAKLAEIFAFVFDQSAIAHESQSGDRLKNSYISIIESYKQSKEFANNGYLRTGFTSFLVNDFIDGIYVEKNDTNPILSKVMFDQETLLGVNILKHFSYICLISSSRLKAAESRGEEIVAKIFERIDASAGELLPEDFQNIYHLARNKKRIICDFIAGMTDRYAIEFYGRLFSESPQTIFKPI